MQINWYRSIYQIFVAKTKNRSKKKLFIFSSFIYLAFIWKFSNSLFSSHSTTGCSVEIIKLFLACVNSHKCFFFVRHSLFIIIIVVIVIDRKFNRNQHYKLHFHKCLFECPVIIINLLALFLLGDQQLYKCPKRTRGI